MKLNTSMAIVFHLLSSLSLTAHAKFDIKAKLLEHRAKHTNHLEKNAAYDFLRRHDKQSELMWQHVVDTQERRLHEHDASGQRMLSSVQHAEAQRQLHTARRQLERFRVESNEERKERYGELHEAMVDMHTSGLEELDFGRTGI